MRLSISPPNKAFLKREANRSRLNSFVINGVKCDDLFSPIVTRFIVSNNCSGSGAAVQLVDGFVYKTVSSDELGRILKCVDSDDWHVPILDFRLGSSLGSPSSAPSPRSAFATLGSLGKASGVHLDVGVIKMPYYGLNCGTRLDSAEQGMLGKLVDHSFSLLDKRVQSVKLASSSGIYKQFFGNKLENRIKEGVFNDFISRLDECKRVAINFDLYWDCVDKYLAIKEYWDCYSVKELFGESEYLAPSIHSDFTLANLVLDREGAIKHIDNDADPETLLPLHSEISKMIFSFLHFINLSDVDDSQFEEKKRFMLEKRAEFVFNFRALLAEQDESFKAILGGVDRFMDTVCKLAAMQHLSDGGYALLQIINKPSSSKEEVNKIEKRFRRNLDFFEAVWTGEF